MLASNCSGNHTIHGHPKIGAFPLEKQQKRHLEEIQESPTRQNVDFSLRNTTIMKSIQTETKLGTPKMRMITDEFHKNGWRAASDQKQEPQLWGKSLSLFKVFDGNNGGPNVVYIEILSLAGARATFSGASKWGHVKKMLGGSGIVTLAGATATFCENINFRNPELWVSRGTKQHLCMRDVGGTRGKTWHTLTNPVVNQS